MRSLLIFTVLAVHTICAHAAPGGPVLSVHCPDPTGCTQNNGTGVYYAEDGFAGIGEQEQLLITHFMPGGAGVRFQGRYFEVTMGRWQVLVESGSVTSADYNGETGMEVVAVTADGTTPTWTLQGVGPSPVLVTGDALAHLKLYLRFDVGSGTKEFVVDFAGREAPHAEVGRRQPRHYVMRWGPRTSSRGATRTYCLDAQRNADSVVFQQGIYVNPSYGAVTRDSTTAQFVTMSCGLGAPATAYKWGYDHNGPLPPFYFDAAIQMKRASYCADELAYTVAGTPIAIADDRRINRTDRLSDLPEASWTPDGAICVNLDQLRHWEKGFTGWCGNYQLPACAAPASAHSNPPWLDDWKQN